MRAMCSLAGGGALGWRLQRWAEPSIPGPARPRVLDLTLSMPCVSRGSGSSFQETPVYPPRAETLPPSGVRSTSAGTHGQTLSCSNAFFPSLRLPTKIHQGWLGLVFQPLAFTILYLKSTKTLHNTTVCDIKHLRSPKEFEISPN